mgnify:CR=1 FL=1
MSLLLDALKKAADDKLKASQNDVVNGKPTAVPLTEDNASRAGLIAENVVSLPDEAASFSESFSQEIPQQTDADESDDSESLTLESIETAQTEPVLTLDEVKVEQLVETSEQKLAVSKKAGINTVSDEALSLLIHKTNRDAKSSKRVIVISVLLASFAVLVSGGIYYYLDVQTEIASLERKHQIAMQAMRSKTSDGNVAEKSEIIRSFASQTAPEDRVALAKKQIANKEWPSEKNTQRKTESNAISKKQIYTAKENTIKNNKSMLSIQRTNTSDPLGEKLDAAWLAYENGQYDESERQYLEVMRLEKNNRDALLGLGAIAIHNKDVTSARRYYLALLKQDPRDPMATAAIASLHDGVASIETDEEYLLTMLESNTQDAHLNFALGNVYAQKGEWKAAQDSYFNAWQQDSENADYVFNLAISMDQLGKQQQALKFYNESLHKSMNKQVSFSREAVRQRIKTLSEQ